MQILKRKQIMLEKWQDDYLDFLSGKTNMSKSSLVRTMIDQFILEEDRAVLKNKIVLAEGNYAARKLSERRMA